MPHPDIAIAGAGLIGLSLALHLADLGHHVAVFTAAEPLREASIAAAGMLAVDDPHNPPALHPLSRFSRDLYPAFLDRLNAVLPSPVLPQTTRTFQELPSRQQLPPASPPQPAALPPGLVPHHAPLIELAEWSLDPRDLAAALHHAVQQTSVALHHHTPVHALQESAHSVTVHTSAGVHTAGAFVDCTGAWSLSSATVPSLRVSPRKGQMLTVATPPSLAQSPFVLRTEHIYAVPRTHGSRAGHTVIGASVEDRGFDRSVDPQTLQHLLASAAAFLPSLAAQPIVESWSGLRPATPDSLPLLGPLPGHRRCFIASGHFRNGILLAPGTATLVADLMLGHAPALNLHPFAPDRLLAQPVR